MTEPVRIGDALLIVSAYLLMALVMYLMFRRAARRKHPDGDMYQTKEER
jgi:hypothetical protein